MILSTFYRQALSPMSRPHCMCTNKHFSSLSTTISFLIKHPCMRSDLYLDRMPVMHKREIVPYLCEGSHVRSGYLLIVHPKTNVEGIHLRYRSIWDGHQSKIEIIVNTFGFETFLNFICVRSWKYIDTGFERVIILFEHNQVEVTVSSPIDLYLRNDTRDYHAPRLQRVLYRAQHFDHLLHILSN